MTVFVIFSLCCSLIGLVNNTLANTYTWDTSPCKLVVYNEGETSAIGNWLVTYPWTYDPTTGVLGFVGQGPAYGVTKRPVYAKSVYWSGTSWITVNYLPYGVWQMVTGQLGQGPLKKINGIYIDDYTQYGKCDECTPQKHDVIQRCGGDENVDWSTWSNQTCTGGQCILKTEKNQGPPCDQN